MVEEEHSDEATEAEAESVKAPDAGGDPIADPEPAHERGRKEPARLAVAFLLGVAAMGLVSFFLVRAARKSATASLPVPPPAALASEVPDAAAEAPSAAAPDAATPASLWRLTSLADDPTVKLSKGEIGHRTVLAALTSLGLDKAEVFRLVKAFDGVKSLDHASPKDTYAVAMSKDSGKIVAFEYATSPLDVWQAREKEGVLEADRLEMNVEPHRIAVGLAVGDDLRESVVKAGLDDDMLGMLDDALEGHAELADVRPGARLRIVATEDRVDGAFVRYESLDAVEYTPANPAAPKLRVYYYAKAPSPQTGGARARPGAYYDAKGQQPYHGGWRSPVPLARIASRFNPRRMHPVLHIIMPHNGVDFAAPPGTPVYASAAGVVKSAGDGGPCGNMIQILHANGLVSAYCHLSRFAAGLHVGQHVESRQLIGYVGQTGRATGPHLHFAIKRGEVFMDPLGFKLDGVRVLPMSMRDDFVKERVEMDLALEAIPLPPPAGTEGGASPDETVFDDSPGL